MTTDREDYGVSLLQEESDRRVERGQRVLVRATVNAPTNAKEPTGNWWVQVDGIVGLVAVHETEIEVVDADDNARLRAENERLRAALKEIASHDGTWQGAETAYRHIRAAKAALAHEQNAPEPLTEWERTHWTHTGKDGFLHEGPPSKCSRCR